MLRIAITLMLVLLPMDRAVAHEFSLGVYAVGGDAKDRIVSAVRGVLLAADERDAHPDETSDGHLGGVDVQIILFLDDRSFTLPELKNTHRGQIDLLLLLDTDAAATTSLPGTTDQTIILYPGKLPDRSLWSDRQDASGFAARYVDVWSMEPDIFAAQGYNAARRIDMAIRPQDGVEEIDAIRDALSQSMSGIDWR